MARISNVSDFMITRTKKSVYTEKPVAPDYDFKGTKSIQKIITMAY